MGKINMKLYIMRHGQAEDIAFDPEQGLSNEGNVAIEGLAQKLSGKNITFKQVFHSDKTRARQTAEIMARRLAPGIVPVYQKNLKPNDNPELIIPDIGDCQHDTLIVSHLPFLPRLLMKLTQYGQTISFNPGTIVCLSVIGPKWQIEWIEQP